MQITPRIVFAAIVAACIGLVAFAIFYLQEHVGLDPCPMCVLSRICFMAIAATALVAAIHGPRGRPLKVYASLVALFAVTGLGISLRHSYLQHFPPKMETCGTDLAFLLGNLPLSAAFSKVFAGTGSCSAVHWKFLGLSIPEWAGVWFLGMAAVVIWLAFVRPRRAAA